MVPRLMVILSTLTLLAVGLVMVYSSSSITSYVEAGDAMGEAVKQLLFAAIGAAFALGVILFVKQDFMRGTGGLIFWGICGLFLLLTPIIGTSALGAKRWILLGPISIQISEFLKIALVIMAARIAEDYREGGLSYGSLALQAAVFVIFPLGFMFLSQSDLGTTMICVVGLFTVMVCAGLSGRAIAGLLVLVVVAAIVAVVSSGYRSDRFIFLDPWSDEQDTGYQLIHSFKALASGGLIGSGIGNSYEKMLWLPEAETDFIFAIIGEELGFVGAAVVVLAFVAFLYGGYSIAREASTPFGAFVAAGLTTMCVFQAFLNIACVIGIAPTTGKPLPFISSGGSSLISSLLLVGVILAISFDSHNEGEYRQRRDNLRVVSSSSQPGRARRTSAQGGRDRSARAMGEEARAPRAAGNGKASFPSSAADRLRTPRR